MNKGGTDFGDALAAMAGSNRVAWTMHNRADVAFWPWPPCNSAVVVPLS
jgi:hypothetical protein